MAASLETGLCSVMEEIARAAGEVIRRGHASRRRKGKAHEVKDSPIDLVTSTDKKADRLIRAMIMDVFPGHGIVSEEGARVGSSTGHVWYVDPLDGTTNFVHGYPHFCVSLAVEFGGTVMAGCVYDPVRDELFLAKRGRGSTLNGRRIRVSAAPLLERSLLATGFPYDVGTSPDNNLAQWSAFAVKARALRRDGSAALDLCYVAAGRFDGFWEIKLKPWDVAAGMLLVEEAGGRVSDYSGGRARVDSREMLASNGAIHGEMMEVLKTGRAA